MVSVDDSGPGIPEELHARLLEPFVTRGKPGCNGLGLAVVKKVVDDHRGRIEVGKSKAGGARLEVYLPLGSESGRGLLPARRGAASIG